MPASSSSLIHPAVAYLATAAESNGLAGTGVLAALAQVRGFTQAARRAALDHDGLGRGGVRGASNTMTSATPSLDSVMSRRGGHHGFPPERIMPRMRVSGNDTFGPGKIAMDLKRYHDVTIGASSVWRILNRLGMKRLPHACLFDAVSEQL